MKTSLKYLRTNGFTIVELLIVIIVIGILASITIVTYGGVQKQAIDKAVVSDIDGISSEIVRYQVSHDGQLGAAVAWYSPSGNSATLTFTPTKGNVIDVVANTTQYCVRVYNRSAKTYTSLSKSFTRGSDTTACSSLSASAAAYTADPT